MNTVDIVHSGISSECTVDLQCKILELNEEMNQLQRDGNDENENDNDMKVFFPNVMMTIICPDLIYFQVLEG